MVHILDGTAIGFPWLIAGDDQTTCHRIGSDAAARRRPRLIALDRDDLPTLIVDCLKRAGIDLDAYREVSRIPLPYGGKPDRVLRLLVPAR